MKACADSISHRHDWLCGVKDILEVFADLHEGEGHM